MLDRPILAPAASARKRIAAGEVPVVPDLWRYEVSNAIVIAERHERLSADQVNALAADLEEFSEGVESDPSTAHVAGLIETARRAGLTAYDAAYLELALRRKLPLATLDLKLQKAARRCGVELV